MRINYISYGISKTGGYRHEKCLFKATCEYFKIDDKIEGSLIRKPKLFTSIFGYIELMLWSFFKSNADINIVTARIALSAIFRNWFSKSEVWVVLHNFDESDGKSGRMKLYYKLLFKYLKKTEHSRFKLITGAQYWVDYFNRIKGLKHVFLFPNFFDPTIYEPYRINQKDKWIFMGQWSTKNDDGITALAAKLSEAGYYCYFSTLLPAVARSYGEGYEIICFPRFEDYLEKMSKCCYTLALTKVNEGWNRIAHESLLVNTLVIGYGRGGLGELLKESNSIIVNSTEEAYNCILVNANVLPNGDFIEKYSTKNTQRYINLIWSNH